MIRRYRTLNVGDYTTRSWPYALDKATHNYVHEPFKPNYRDEMVIRKTGTMIDDSWGPNSTYTRDTYDILEEEEIVNTHFTIVNSQVRVRHEQASILAQRSYFGPISGGEARALKTLFNELGHTDLVKHGWVLNNVMATRQPSRYVQRRAMRLGVAPPIPVRVDTVRLQNCYLFKSPLDSVPFSKFIKLARMYKDDDGRLRTAVVALLANPDAHKEIETLDTLEILGGMSGL